MTKQEILKKNDDRIWLVKSGDVILGPYTISELAQNVRSKSIRLLDEARTPSQRWLFVRDIPEIQNVISKLSQQEDTFEKTHSSATQSLTVTRNIIEDENTPVPPQVPLAKVIPIEKSSAAKANGNTAPANPVPQPQATSASSSATMSSASNDAAPIKSYSVNPPSEPIPWGKWGMIAFAAISFMIAMFTFLQRKSWESDQKKVWSEFQQLYAAQLYDDAYKKMKEYQREFPDQATALTRAGFLYLNPGRELVSAKRMFDRSSQLEPNNKDVMVQNLNGLGLVALYEGQMVQAKSYFDRALTLEPGSILTRMNMISLGMSQGQWTDAYSLASQITAAEPKKAFLIQSTISLLSSQYAEKGKPLLVALTKSVDNSSYLRPIMRLMMIKLSSLHADALTLEMHIKQFFDDLPSLHVNFTETPQIDQRWRDWNFLFQFCNDLKGPPSLDADLAAVQIVCTAQIQKWNEAERLLNEATKRFPANPKIFLAQLHLFTMMERWPDVRALMRGASLTSDVATNWMFAKACIEEKNKSCTDLYLNPLLQKSPIPTPVFELQARNQCVERVSDSCRFAISQGLAQDPSAYGLLKIKFQIEAGL